MVVPEIHQHHRFVSVPAALRRGREAWTQRRKGENAIATARGSVYVWHRIRFLKLPCFVRGIFLCHELLSAGAVPIVCLANALEPLIRLDGRKAFDPAAQIGREHECATSTFHGTERARTNCLIESGPTGTRD